MRRNLPLSGKLALILVLGALLAPAGSAFEIEQLTCLPGGCPAPGPQVYEPRLTGDGKRVLVRSACDLDPGRNPHGIDQVFFFDLASRRFQQITPPQLDWARGRTCGYEVASDASGERIVLVASCGDYTDLDVQLLEYRGQPGVLEPLPRFAPVPCFMEAAVSGDGKHLAVVAECRPGKRVRGRSNLRFEYRQKLYLQDAPGGALTRFRRRARRCRIFHPRLSHDGRMVVVSSECDLERGSNPERDVHHFRIDRRDGRVERVNPPGCHVGVNKPPPLVALDPPTLSADGQVVAFSSGACGTGLSFLDDSHVFRRRVGGDLEQLTFGFCLTQDHPPGALRGITQTYVPVAASADGGTIAFGMWCDDPPIFSGVTDRLVVYRDDAEPRSFEIFSQPAREQGPYAQISAPSVDDAGSSLVVAAPLSPGGCPSVDGAHQLYLVRNLQDPTPGPSTCACGSPAP